MVMLQKFFTSYTFIVGFMITCIFIQMLFGAGFLNKFLWLILISMVLINSNDFIETFKKTENNYTTLEKVDGKIEGLVTKDAEIETTIRNLKNDNETKFTEIENK